jgi:dihydroneopterin aldolase
MVFSASVGVADWERQVPTKVEVDVEIETDLRKACLSDNLHDTINYSEVYEQVGKIVASRHHNLMEALAQKIADGVLGLSGAPGIRCVTVRIRKPNPPFKGICAFAEIVISRRKAADK